MDKGTFLDILRRYYIGAPIFSLKKNYMCSYVFCSYFHQS